ncbi:hypothetical protein D3C80_1149230 [compost metagenome]
MHKLFFVLEWIFLLVFPEMAWIVIVGLLLVEVTKEVVKSLFVGTSGCILHA